MSSAATVARLSFCTIAAGVPAGRKSAYQLGMSKPVSPCSCADGRSGMLDERFLLRIAIALTVLAGDLRQRHGAGSGTVVDAARHQVLHAPARRCDRERA